MDSITQAALGGAIGGAVLGRSFGRKAVLVGAMLGTVPDLDVVVDYGDPVADMTRHRGFSHSLFILLPFSLVLAALLWRWRPAIPFRRWWACTGLVLLTHPLLDSFTTYGTQIFWPWGEPVSIASLFIIDPAYTVPLLIGIGLFLWRPDRLRPVVASLVLSTAYIAWSVAAQQVITLRTLQVLADNGLTDAPRLIQPMPLSTLLWRVTVVGEDRRLEMVTGLLDSEGPPQIATYLRDPALASSALATADGERLHWFTDGVIDWSVDGDQLVATDIRLGVPGHHPFAFTIARRSDDGHWRAVRPIRRPEPALRPDQLTSLVRRIGGDTGALCLAGQPAAVRNVEPC
ncbi:inner membrane protein [Tamilnaduibacter salinus]|uniref:Inner membrane protein n=1 Tax=Tamilnaduibacter salinus TaxID=1484056 RepID=A0A2U1CWH3_9GAMM|nr:metal-dependent hydrolase [Tamilnaduibacter salinus]PVY76339.1 inner membrane protein [Tamilnaduibacter salinus]